LGESSGIQKKEPVIQGPLTQHRFQLETENF